MNNDEWMNIQFVFDKFYESLFTLKYVCILFNSIITVLSRSLAALGLYKILVVLEFIRNTKYNLYED